MKYISIPFSLLLFVLLMPGSSWCQLKHSTQTLYPSYKGLVMAGYQGWFRNPTCQCDKYKILPVSVVRSLQHEHN